jgi:hypothetical protein
VDEVADLELFSYDQNKNFIVRKTHKKRKLTMDSEAVIITEKVIIDTKKGKERQIYSMGLVVSHASYEQVMMEEREL